MDSAPKLERQSRKCGYDAENMPQFGGNIHESSDNESVLSDANSMVNNVVSESETDSETDISENSSGDSEDSDNSRDADSVFDMLIEEAEQELGKTATHEDIKKLFRHKLAEKIEWSRNLRKHPIYKKIMVTAQDLLDGPGGYDFL